MNTHIPELEGLSAAECELISIRVSGNYVKQIPSKVGRSPSAVAHLLNPGDKGSVFRKIPGVTTTVQLAIWWTELVNSAVQNLDTFLSGIEELDLARRAGNAKSVGEETGKGIVVLSHYLNRHPNDPRRHDIQRRVSELLRVRGFALFDTNVPPDLAKSFLLLSNASATSALTSVTNNRSRIVTFWKLYAQVKKQKNLKTI